ncbi:hypothetical protein AMS68_002101 [Peltaster fructicola]|uniref:Uncharacterized protein n=1 Tax=Peltaster fructicola TaxID=286661 RepID=A0A6H0XPC8_9PEZI|nr:hypothetical protein AMS68_002101 [Peltaster fructicola]
MHSFKLLLSFLVLLCGFSWAYPINDTAVELLDRRYVKDQLTPGDPKAKDNYPTDAEIIKDFHDPGENKYVFYSGVGDKKDAPTKFAKSIGGKMLSECFSDEKYLGYNGRGKGWHGNFVDRASGVMADHAHGEVFFLADFDKKPRDCSVWNRVELGSLKANKKVTKITEVDYKDFSKRRDLPKDESTPVHPKKPTYCED